MFQIRHNSAAQTDAAALCRRDAPPPAKLNAKVEVKMKKLLIYMKKFRKECILAPLFKLLEATFELFLPLIVAAIIDNGIDGKSKSFIINMGLCFGTCGGRPALFRNGTIFFAAKAAIGFCTDLRAALLKKNPKFFLLRA